MRNRPVRRWAAALLNLLFLLAWGEPVSAHPCPMHDGAAFVAATAGHSAHAASAVHAAHVAPGDAGAHAGHVLPAPARVPDGAADHTCQCLGDCSAASTVALPGAVAVRWQATIRQTAEPPLAEPVAPSAASPRLLPFANGPPRQA